METQARDHDAADIGTGRTGIEAVLAAARMGMDTVCMTVSLDAAGGMPCKMAIDGTARTAWCGNWTSWVRGCALRKKRMGKRAGRRICPGGSIEIKGEYTIWR